MVTLSADDTGPMVQPNAQHHGYKTKSSSIKAELSRIPIISDLPGALICLL